MPRVSSVIEIKETVRFFHVADHMSLLFHHHHHELGLVTATREQRVRQAREIIAVAPFPLQEGLGILLLLTQLKGKAGK